MRDCWQRAMPHRFLVAAPFTVRKNVLDIIEIRAPEAPQHVVFSVVFRGEDVDGQTAGCGFSPEGRRGQHFFMSREEYHRFRSRNARKAVYWQHLPEATQRAICAYLQS